MTIEDIKAEVDKLKRKSTQSMIAAIVAVILLIVLAFAVFRQQPKTDDSYKVQMQHLQDKINLLEQSNALRDSLIHLHDAKLLENRKTETIIKHHYDKISVDVPKLNNNQLKDEITNY